MALRAVSQPTPPARSPERERLAEMIERVREVSARRAATHAALQQAERAVWDANAAVERAEAAIEDSKAATAKYLIEVAGGNSVDPPQSTRAARDRLVDAEDQRDAARAARDQLQRQRDGVDNLDLYRMQLRENAGRVLAVEWQSKADALVTEITTTFPDLIEKAELVRRLSDVGLFGAARNSLRQLVGPAGAVARLSDTDLMPGSDAARARGAATFAAMMDALTNDPDAALPP